MIFLCVMPTYGRRASLLNNSIACFASQTHNDKKLIIYDDLGTLNHTDCNYPGVHILSTPYRSASVGDKYNVIMQMATILKIHYDAVAVWDDDDIYLSNYLATHAKILQTHKWSKPSTIISKYHTPPQEEKGAGRFHGSMAASKDFLYSVEGWIETKRATFDQEMLAKLNNASPPGDPCTIAPPQYIYRWQTSGGGHCSGLMGKENWYDLYQPDSREPIPSLWPEYDADTKQFIQGYQAPQV
jgi:hypothetical protein